MTKKTIAELFCNYEKKFNTSLRKEEYIITIYLYDMILFQFLVSDDLNTLTQIYSKDDNYYSVFFNNIALAYLNEMILSDKIK